MGEGDRAGRASDQAAESGAEPRRARGLPVAGRRDELVLALVTIPATGLFYMQTFEKCSIYTKADPGSGRREGVSRAARSGRTTQKAERILKAIDIKTGKIVWELPQPGPAESWGGTLATSTGLVIFGEEGGALMAADAVTGKPLWSFPTNQTVEGVADDVPVRRESVHRGGVGAEHDRVRAGRPVVQCSPGNLRRVSFGVPAIRSC